jgi:hypothetical protein
VERSFGIEYTGLNGILEGSTVVQAAISNPVGRVDMCVDINKPDWSLCAKRLENSSLMRP